MIEKGFANVPLDAPGLGIELNEEECKKHLGKDSGWFNPTPEWDQKRVARQVMELADWN